MDKKVDDAHAKEIAHANQRKPEPNIDLIILMRKVLVY